MKDDPFRSLIFAAGLVIGVGAMYASDQGDLAEQAKTIATLEAEVKSKPLITVDAPGICQVTQGGKVYMLVDITEEMQANKTDEAIGLEEKHNQLMESYEEKK